LVCSGGHTALYRCTGPTNLELLGTTIDDAAGEAFDKVASILNLGYPGGPAIDKIAREGNPQAVDFPRTLLSGQSLDFSFSGIKTAVLYYVNGTPKGPKWHGRPARESNAKGLDAAQERPAHMEADPEHNGIASFTPQQIADTAASFQAAVVDVLRIKLRRAAKAIGAKTLLLGGGVAANSALRETLTQLAATMRCTLRMPPMRFCVDNAAMIAGLGYHYLQAGMTSGLELEANATVRR
jgi:N6-L-threonylcarbamoyladenine synthase